MSGSLSNVFGATADGQRFLIADDVAAAREQVGYRVVVNWAAELK